MQNAKVINSSYTIFNAQTPMGQEKIWLHYMLLCLQYLRMQN